MTDTAVITVAARDDADTIRSMGVGALLQSAYPGVFNAARAPLKIGIDKDIRARHPGIDRKSLGCFLFKWTNHRHYLENCLDAAAQRRDLDGNPCGAVTDQGVLIAAAKLPAQKPGRATTPPPVGRAIPEPFRSVLTTAPADQPLDAETHALLLEALEAHPERDEKVGCGVQAFVVDGRYRAFAVVRTDGTRDTFSIKRCLAALKARSGKKAQAEPGEAAVPVSQAA